MKVPKEHTDAVPYLPMTYFEHDAIRVLAHNTSAVQLAKGESRLGYL